MTPLYIPEKLNCKTVERTTKQNKRVMETIADLNNSAVTYIDANKLKEAIKILVRALELTRNQLYHDLGSPNVEGGSLSCRSSTTCRAASHHEAPHNRLTELPSFTRSPHRNIPMVNHDHVRRSGGNDSKRPFNYCSGIKYQQPFFAFQELDHRYDESTLIHLTSNSESHTISIIQLSAIVIFNCALCHDRLAQSAMSSTTRQGLRDKAIALYEKVVDLYIESRAHCMIGVDTMNNPLVSRDNCLRRAEIVGAQQDMIAMAAVNNLVQLHHESSQERYNYCQLMMALFQEIQRTDYGSQEIQSRVDTQARVFVSNVVMSWNLELVLAAAAA